MPNQSEYYCEVTEEEVPRTKRTRWWALRYPDGGLHGEEIKQGEGNPGFTLGLFNTQKSAQDEANRLNDPDFPQMFPVEVIINQQRNASGHFGVVN